MARRGVSERDDGAGQAVPPLFEEWDESQLDQDWTIEAAMGANETESTYHEFVEQLDEQLSNDIGYGSEEDTIETLARMFVEDKPNYARADQIIRQHKISRLVNQAVRTRARQLNNVQPVPGGGEALNMRTVIQEYDDAPVHPDAVVPASWVIDGKPGGARRYRLIKKVVRRKDGEIYEEHIGVAYNPIVISATMIDISDSTANQQVSWFSRGKWRNKVVPRKKTLQPRELLDSLGSVRGFPAHTNNAKDIIAYLADYEAYNESVIPVRPMSTQMGWQRDGELGFVVGKQHIKIADNQPSVHFVGVDEGEEQLADCTKRAGSFEEWAKAAKIASHFPSVELAIYAALAPPLLLPLRAPNFTIDWSHKTSSGKTTTLSLAASCWGDPDPNGRNSLMASWDMTPVGFERRAAALSCLPLIVDDTKRAKSYRGESIVPGVVYEVSNGQGRIRGSVKGTSKTSYWRTIMLSTGEQRIIDFDKSGGTPARVITLWGNPFGGTTKMVGDAIRKMKGHIADNFGHAGPAFVEWLTEHRADWPELRAEHAERVSKIETRMLELSVGNLDMSVLGRVATYLGVLQLAAECAHEAMALPWELRDPIGDLLPSLVHATSAVDRELEALRSVVSWAVANRGKFCVSEKHRRDDEPNGGWLGFWEAAQFDGWDRIAFFPVSLKRFLQEQGYEPNSVIRQWAEAGWLDCVEGRTTTRVNELNGRPRLVVLTRRAVGEHGGLEGPDQHEIPF